MKQLLLIGVLLPCIASAQEVKPVLSPYYQSLIDSIAARKPVISFTDTVNNMRQAPYRYNGNQLYDGIRIRHIVTTKDGSIILHPVKNKILSFGTTVSFTAAVQHHTKLPATQNEYAQGRSEAGVVKWRGAETGEVLSFGPSLRTLSFDGSNYTYDKNGRLVNGNGIPAYDNSILRNGSLLSQNITLHARLRKTSYRSLTVSLRTGLNQQRLILDRNRNKVSQLSLFFNGQHERFTASGNYAYRQSLFSNSNRNGLLNRAWQYSLLTPVSFSNTQGSLISPAVQRSYSPSADNPLFLLKEDAFLFRERQHTAFITGGYRINRLQVSLSQSLENIQWRSDESRQPGTAGFLPGTALLRTTHDKNYNINARANYGLFDITYLLRGRVTLNYLYTTNRSVIAYNKNASRYHYQRSLHDMSIVFSPEYNKDLGRRSYLNAGLNLTSRLYASNTSTDDNYFMPSASGYVRIERPFNLEGMTARFFGGYTRFNSEMPLSRSAGYANLLQYKVAEANEYLPIKEINGFDNLAPVEHRELTAGFDIYYSYKATLSLNWFSRRTTNDLFPVNNGSSLSLVNMASLRNKGLEAELSINIGNNRNKFTYNSNISIASARTRVTNVTAGYEGTPIAGFSDVYKALVKGRPVGVIMGSTWLRDAAGNRIIGSDGFPLVNNTPQVIGDPNPDMVLKTSQKITFKNKLTLTIEPEWRIGGDIWNGTRAALDYHGRSAASAAERNITGYVFNGVLQGGAHNNIPVSYYDPSKPVEQNRWVRYGMAGVAEDYIESGDCIRINTISLSYKPRLKKKGADLTLGVYVNNILLWTRYKGTDPSGLLQDEPAMNGLDFFNTPGVRSAGFTATFQL